MLRSDATLGQLVADELAADAHCRGAAIAVDVVHGVVTLTGLVPDQACRGAVVRAVKRVFGVEGHSDRLALTSGTATPAAASATVGGIPASV